MPRIRNLQGGSASDEKITTKDMLAQTLTAINEQTHKNWRLFLMGDLYEPDKEFREIARLVDPKKIVAVNLKHTPERFNPVFLKSRKPLGIKACNFALDLMNELGIRYVATIDDDDMWLPNHLELINEEFQRFPKPAMVCTLANFRNAGILPQTTWDINGVPAIPKLACNVVHSSVAWDSKRLPYRYRNMVENTPWQTECGDADLWARMQETCQKEGYRIAIVPHVTVEYR